MNKLKIITALLIWGSVGLFARQIFINSTMVSFFRSFIGTLFLIIYKYSTKKKIDFTSFKNNYKPILISSLSIAIELILFFESLKYTTIAITTITYYLAPLFMMIASIFILKEKLTKKRILSLAIAFIGIVLITISKDSSSDYSHITGIFLALIASIFYANIVITNKFTKNIDSLDLTIFELFFATLFLFIFIIITRQFTLAFSNITEIVCLVIIGVFQTGIAFTVYFSAFHKVSAQTIALLSYIDPLFAIILSATILKESLFWWQFIGIVLILISTYFVCKQE